MMTLTSITTSSPISWNAPQIETGRIDQGGASDHQLLGLHLLVAAFERRQLHPVVGPSTSMALSGGRRRWHSHPTAMAMTSVRVELALGILVVQTRQPAAQLATVGHQHAGGKRMASCLGIGILLLDDADHLAIAAHDAAITGRVSPAPRSAAPCHRF